MLNGSNNYYFNNKEIKPCMGKGEHNGVEREREGEEEGEGEGQRELKSKWSSSN